MTQQQTDKEARRVVEGGPADRESQQPANKADNRTPDKTIGQVEYADTEGGGEQKTQGGSTRTTLEPTAKVKATNNAGLQDDHDPSDISQRANSRTKADTSQREGPAAYAPHRKEEGMRSNPERAPVQNKTGAG